MTCKAGYYWAGTLTTSPVYKCVVCTGVSSNCKECSVVNGVAKCSACIDGYSLKSADSTCVVCGEANKCKTCTLKTDGSAMK